MFDALNANSGCNVADHPTCRHCATNKAHVNAKGFAVYRGLCNRCYNDRDIRDLYPPRKVNRKPAEKCADCGGFMPGLLCPVCTIRNDQERETLRRRLDLYGLRSAAGLPLFDGLPPLDFENQGVR